MEEMILYPVPLLSALEVFNHTFITYRKKALLLLIWLSLFHLGTSLKPRLAEIRISYRSVGAHTSERNVMCSGWDCRIWKSCLINSVNSSFGIIFFFFIKNCLQQLCCKVNKLSVGRLLHLTSLLTQVQHWVFFGMFWYKYQYICQNMTTAFLLNLKLLSELSGYLEVLLFLLVIFEILYKPQIFQINEYFPFILLSVYVCKALGTFTRECNILIYSLIGKL